MKKIFKLLSLLTATAILLSGLAVPGIADEAAGGTFTEVVKLTFDELGLAAGDTYRDSGTVYYPAWPDSFVGIGGYDSSVALSDIKGADNLMAQGINNSTGSNVTYTVLPDIAKTKDAETVALRKRDTALSFNFIMSSDMYVRVLATGTHPDYVESFTEGSNVLTGTLMEIKEGSDNVVNYSYTPGSTTEYTAKSNATVFKRDTLHNVKFVFEAPEYTDGALTGGGSYDVYFDDMLIQEDLKLAGPGYLYKLFIQFFAKNNVATGTSYIDDIAYYALGEGDSTAQTTYSVTGNGDVVSEKAVTKVGDTQSFVITPDEGYEIRRVTYNGEAVLGYDSSGFTYETPALTSEGGSLEVIFDEIRTFKKMFENNFNGFEAGAVLADTASDSTVGNNASVNLATSSNIFAYDAVISAYEEAEGDNSAMITLPAGDTVIPTASMYAFIDKNAFANTVYDTFAVTFKVKADDNQYYRYTARNAGENNTHTNSSTLMEVTGGNVYFYEYYYDEAGTRQLRTVKTGYNVNDGEYHTYKLIFNPKQASYDGYVDNILMVDDGELAGSDWIYYNLLQLQGSKTEDMVGYIDDYECYELSKQDVTAQVSVTSANGTVTADKAVTAVGDTVSLNIAPDKGYEIASVSYNGEDITGFDKTGFVYEAPALTAEGGALSVTYNEVRHFEKIFAVDFDSYAENTVIVDTANDGTVGNQTGVNLLRVDNTTTSNIWAMDTAITAYKEADGEISAQIYMPQGTAKTDTEAEKKSSISMYALLPDSDGNNVYQETTTDYFSLSFKLKTDNNQTGRYMLRSKTNDTGGKALFQLLENRVIFYDYYYNEENAYVYRGINSGIYVNDGQYHYYKIVFNPKNETYDAYVDNIQVADDAGFPDSTEIYYSALQLYGSVDADMTAYLDEFECYEMTAEDAAAQISGSGSGNGTIFSDKTVTGAGETVNLTIAPDTGSFIKNLTYKGKNVPAFDSDAVYEISANAGDTLAVEFYDYTENAPAIVTTSYAVKEDNRIYLFNKLIENGTEVTEFGMLFSRTNSEPQPDGEDTSVIVYDAQKAIYGDAVHEYGYHGYMLFNSTGEENITFYIRPYAKAGGETYLGDVKEIDTSELESIAGE